MLRWAGDTDFEMFLADPLRRAAIERQAIILGEALAALRRAAPEIAGRLPDLRRAIRLRNVPVHTYDEVDPSDFWTTVTQDMPGLLAAVTALRAELEPG